MEIRKLLIKQLLFAIVILPILAISIISVPLGISYTVAQQWSEAEPMPTARSEIAATNKGDDIYVIGGLDESGDPMDVVEIYNVQDNSWKSVAPLPKPLHHTAATSFDGKIYVVGGFLSREWIPTSYLFIYDPVDNIWKEGEPMPSPRGALNALFVNGILYAIGGQDQNGVLNVNEAYDPSTNSWASKSPLPTSRHHAASAAVDNKIYVTGGRTVMFSPSENVNVNEMYDTEKNKWITVESMPSKRSGIAAAAVNNSVFVFGGEDLTKSYDSNEEYDTQEDKWISQQPIPTARHGLAAVSVGDRVFVIGGGVHPGLSTGNDNEVYSLNK